MTMKMQQKFLPLSSLNTGSQRGFALLPIVIAVATLVLIGGGGTAVYYAQRQSHAENEQLRQEIAELKEEIVSPSPEPTTEPSPSPTPTQLPIKAAVTAPAPQVKAAATKAPEPKPSPTVASNKIKPEVGIELCKSYAEDLVRKAKKDLFAKKEAGFQEMANASTIEEFESLAISYEYISEKEPAVRALQEYWSKLGKLRAAMKEEMAKIESISEDHRVEFYQECLADHVER